MTDKPNVLTFQKTAEPSEPSAQLAHVTAGERGNPTREGATCVDIWRGRILERLGTLASRLGAPGAIRNVQIQDAVSGQTLEVQVGPLFTRLTVDGRDYYFRRWSGRFDGTGTAIGSWR